MPVLLSRCGLYCDQCKYRQRHNCLTCNRQAGHLFWGECPLAKCSIEKGLLHCGECDEFVCETLYSMSHDKENGDCGRRIEILQGLQGK